MSRGSARTPRPTLRTAHAKASSSRRIPARKRRGAKIDYEIGDKPYGIREFGVQDLDGHDLAFGSPIE